MDNLRKCFYCGQDNPAPDINTYLKVEFDNIGMPVPENLEDLKIRPKSNREKPKSKREKSEILADIKRLQARQMVSIAKIKCLDAERNQKCNFCGEKIRPNSSDLLSDLETKTYGYELYEQYKKFVEGESLPENIKIEIGSVDGGILGRCRFDKKLNKFVITITKGMQVHKHDLKPLFYHEFTHILDMYDKDTDGEKEGYLNWHSEYHASEIELMAMLGYKSISENKNISLSDTVIFTNETYTLKDFLQEQIKTYFNEFLDKKDMTLDSITSIIRNIAYCRSKINFCKKHLDLDKDSIHDIPNMSEIESWIENKIKDIENEIKDNASVNVVLKKLINLDSCIIDIDHPLKSLDDCITDCPTTNKDGQLFEKIMNKIMFYLSLNLPEYSHWKTFNKNEE